MRPHTKRRRALLAAALVVASSGIVAGVAQANLGNPGGSATFEGNDANTAGAAILANGAFDWANILTAPSGTRSLGPDAATGQCDNSFTQGSKEDETAVVIGQGSIPNSKADLGQFAVGSLVPTSGPRSGHTIMALAWSRNNTSGTTNFDFEINQVAQPSMTFTQCPQADRAITLQRRGDGVAGNAIIDDVLISYDLQGGAQNPTLSFRRWVQDSQNPALPGYFTGHWGPSTTVGSADSEGSFNLNQAISAAQLDGFQPSPGSTGIPVAQFGEADLDMTALGIIPNRNDPNAGCVAFGSGYVKSRASNSFSAQMKDYIAPIGLGINTCGSITLLKDTVPAGDSQVFHFNTSANLDANGADLADATVPTAGNGLYQNLVPGNYSANEVVPTGWDLTGATCTSDKNANENPAAMSLQANENLVCTFTNTKRGRVLVDKVTQPDPDPTGTIFDFTGSFGPFTLTNAQAPFDSGLIVPGSYNVAESAEDGWTQGAQTCSDGSAVNNIQVGAGETVTCTFNNSGFGHIVVHKQTDPAGGGPFGFTSNYGPTFSLNDGDQHSDQVAPGTGYTVGETSLPPGWNQTSGTCSDGSDPAVSIDVSPGETVDCFFSNREDAHIIIVKHVVGPNPDGEDFDYTSDFPAHPTFTLADGGSQDSGALVPGTYTTTETVVAPWKLLSIECSDGSTTGTVTVVAGQTVVCTYTNERQVGAVRIHKVAKSAAAGGLVGVPGIVFTVKDEQGVTFDMPATDAQGFTCVDNFGFQTLQSITETGYPSGYKPGDPLTGVVIDTVSYCDGAYGAPAQEFQVENTPLTDVTITVDSLISGGTSSRIECFDKDGNLLDTLTAEDGSLYIPNIEPTDPLIATLDCKVFIDP